MSSWSAPETGPHGAVFAHPRFELVRRLGVGSMGVVHEAIDHLTGERIALKSLRSHGADHIRRLKREFRVLAGLAHPNLAHLHELFEGEDGCFITMQLVHGTDAHTWMHQAEDRQAAAVALARQLTTALLFLHQHQRLHLDIKPGNMVVEADGTLILLDFGISRALAGALMEGPRPAHWGGTPAYCAPEQLGSEPLTPAADWYGVGATLFELITGKLPHEGSVPHVVKLKKSGVAAVRIRDVAPGVDRSLARLIDRLLSHDPRLRPDGEEVAAQLGATTAEEPSAVSGPAPTFALVGRRSELDRLEAAAASAKADGYAEVELHGPSGVGKTALVRGFLTEQRRNSAFVLAGTSYEREWIPFNAFDSLVTSMVDAIRVFPPAMRAKLVPRRPSMLARLFPEFRRVPEIDRAAGPAEDGRHLNSLPLRRDGFAAFADLLARYAEGRLTVLALDDVQWADRDSLALIDFLRSGGSGSPLLLLLSRRLAPNEEVSKLSPASQVLRIGPLGLDAARELCVASLGTSADAELIDEVLAQAEGVPLWIEQLALRCARKGERPSLDGLFDRAVESLPRQGMAALEALTVSGRPLPLSQLVEFIDADGALRVLDELGVLGLTVPVAERGDAAYEVRHARVREVVAEQMSARRHAQLSLKLAEQYIARRVDDEEVARHLLAAGDSVRGADYAVRAARDAASALAFARSARLLEAAIEHVQSPLRSALLEELGDVLANDARAEAAANAYLQAAEDTDDVARRLQLRHRGAEQLMRSGRVDQGRELLEQLLGESGLSMPHGEAQATLQLLWNRLRLKLRGMDFEVSDEADLDRTAVTRIDAAWSAGATLALVDAVTAAAFQAKGLLEALELGEPERVGRSLGAEAVFRAAFGDHEASRALWERNREMVERRPTAIGRAGLATSESVSAYQRGDWRTAHRAAGESMEHLAGKRLNLSWIRSTAVIYRLAAAGHLGRLEEVGEELPRELEHARARGDLHAVLHLTLGMPIPVAAIMDRAEQGAQEAESVWANSPGRDYAQLQIHYLRTRAELALYRGAFDEAREAGLESWGLVTGSTAGRLPIIRWWACELTLRGLLAASQGPPQGKDRRLVKKLLRELSKADADWARSCGELAAAQLAFLDGDGTDASSRLEAAAAGFERCGMGLYAMAARNRAFLVPGEKVSATHVDEQVWSRWVRWGMNPARLVQMVAPVGGAAAGESHAQRTGALQPPQ